ncbi:helix-turn-helix domain-containing protein [Amycolatopsis sp. NPDC049688]|uniref:helix-turn-helix domain-containing protein n=1 Tax=Amycolatopsis sp. NPDC049688 TaxID=3154733 RepID=UPI003444D313
MTTADAANNGGGAGTNGPPTKPTKKLVLSAKEAAEITGRHHESVLCALRRGLLKGSQASAKASWLIRAADVEDWVSRGAPTGRTA